MSTTTALSVTNMAISNLQGYLTTILPIIVPVIIAVAILFGGILVLKMLWHKRV